MHTVYKLFVEIYKNLLTHFLTIFKNKYQSMHPGENLLETWERCGEFKSPDTNDLRHIWQYYRNNKLDRIVFIKLVSAKLSLLKKMKHDFSGDSELCESYLLLELLLIDGKYSQCIDICEEYTIKFSRDLRLQDIRARAYILQESDSPLKMDPEYGFKPFAGRFCSSTFDTIAFFEREVFICCCNFIPISIGSISSSNVDELWNSSIAQNVRSTILDGSFQYCNKMVCPRLRNRDLPLRTESSLSDYYKKIIAENITASPGCYPRSIELNEDPSCNLTCPSCRTGSIPCDKDLLINFENNILPGILGNEINLFLIACFGEPFASSHYLRILRSLDSKIHHIKQLVIFTNGVLFTREKWEDLSNLHSFNIEVRVSIDATSEETFNLLRRGGDWQALQKNLEFVGSLRKKSEISKLLLNYVVQNDNFTQMHDFVRMGKGFNADEIVFAELQKYGEYALNDSYYAKNAVHLKGHHNHEEFLSMLIDPIMKERVVSFHGRSL